MGLWVDTDFGFDDLWALLVLGAEGVAIDGVEGVVRLDDTYPAVQDWESATIFALELVMRQHPDSNVEFLYNKEYPSNDYVGMDNIHEAPLRIQ